MPKRTVTTIAGAGFSVTTGVKLSAGDTEIPARILHVIDGPDTYDILIADEQKGELADLIRGDGIVIPEQKAVPLPGIRGVQRR